MSTQSTREYIHHLQRAAGPGSRAEILQNALADFLGQVSKSGDRSPREALEKIRSLDRHWQQLAAAGSSWQQLAAAGSSWPKWPEPCRTVSARRLWCSIRQPPPACCSVGWAGTLTACFEILGRRGVQNEHLEP